MFILIKKYPQKIPVQVQTSLGHQLRTIDEKLIFELLKEYVISKYMLFLITMIFRYTKLLHLF